MVRLRHAGPGVGQPAHSTACGRTPPYMSPEKARPESQSKPAATSSRWASSRIRAPPVGCRSPRNSMALLLKHLNEGPRPIAELRPDTPRTIREVIERALMKAPEDRWPTASSLRDALMSDRAPLAAWRGEHREPVRYASPRPDIARPVPPRRGSPAADARSAPAPQRPKGTIELEPEHLASLTPAQRADLRLWHGRVNLFDRLKAARGYLWLTVAAIAEEWSASTGVEGGLRRRVAQIGRLNDAEAVGVGKSLRAFRSQAPSGLLMPSTPRGAPAPPHVPTNAAREDRVTRVLESPLWRGRPQRGGGSAAILASSPICRADRALLHDGRLPQGAGHRCVN